MRIVRFYLEPWQKGGTPSPSASLVLLSPNVKRRQRQTYAVEEKIVKMSNEKLMKERRKSRIRHRFKPTVKTLMSLCSDVLAQNVEIKNLSLFTQSIDLANYFCSSRKLLHLDKAKAI
jgi:hypothetical protein